MCKMKCSTFKSSEKASRKLDWTRRITRHSIWTKATISAQRRSQFPSNRVEINSNQRVLARNDRRFRFPVSNFKSLCWSRQSLHTRIHRCFHVSSCLRISDKFHLSSRYSMQTTNVNCNLIYSYYSDCPLCDGPSNANIVKKQFTRRHARRLFQFFFFFYFFFQRKIDRRAILARDSPYLWGERVHFDSSAKNERGRQRWQQCCFNANTFRGFDVIALGARARGCG